jgi:hypothetical protein
MKFIEIEKEYATIALLSFFETEEDKNIVLEEYFGCIPDSPTKSV